MTDNNKTEAELAIENGSEEIPEDQRILVRLEIPGQAGQNFQQVVQALTTAVIALQNTAGDEVGALNEGFAVYGQVLSEQDQEAGPFVHVFGLNPDEMTAYVLNPELN